MKTVLSRLAPLAALVLLAGCAQTSSGPAMSAANPQSNAAMGNPSLDTGTSMNQVPAPDLHLVNQFGQPMSLSQFRGKVLLLSFEDPECTDVCPLTTQSMVWAKELLGKAGENVQLLGVDANPTATKVTDVMAYSRAHSMVNQWDFLTGTVPQLKAAWKSYNIAVQIEKGDIDHTPALFVIDQRGRERKLYLTQMAYSSVGQSAQVLADEVSSLLPSHPHVASNDSLAAITVQGPGKQVSLDPALGTDRVTLGPGQPRLVMFFASWLSEVSDLKSELRLGNAYTGYARAHGLPPLTGVDETVVEPSQAAVRSYLSGLGLTYPVGLDTTGRVADGFGVQDQPWFSLVSASGKILWSHDGWVSLQALEAAAKSHPLHMS
ncbi:MAG TPA: SCO family protein [Streptosporangiaceae bacterium]|jgi:cytochrome oxidase Cu insertion factor (SCO1/SenC/PrrC family)